MTALWQNITEWFASVDLAMWGVWTLTVILLLEQAPRQQPSDDRASSKTTKRERRLRHTPVVTRPAPTHKTRKSRQFKGARAKRREQLVPLHEPRFSPLLIPCSPFLPHP